MLQIHESEDLDSFLQATTAAEHLIDIAGCAGMAFNLAGKETLVDELLTFYVHDRLAVHLQR